MKFLKKENVNEKKIKKIPMCFLIGNNDNSSIANDSIRRRSSK